MEIGYNTYRFSEREGNPGPKKGGLPNLTDAELESYRQIIDEHMRADPEFATDVLATHPGQELEKLGPDQLLGFAAAALLQEARQRLLPEVQAAQTG